MQPWRNLPNSPPDSNQTASGKPGAVQVIRVQRMTRKWGSCSSAVTITLAIDLVEQSEDFQDFVIAHELLHLKVPNHGRLFKALMTTHVPDWRSQDVRRKCTSEGKSSL
mgnify:CR=1 FL=1